MLLPYLVLGEAGSGKTAWLGQLALALLEDDEEKKRALGLVGEEVPWDEGGEVLWIDAARWAVGEDPSLVRSWSESLDEHRGLSPEQRERNLELRRAELRAQRNRGRRTWVLVDGAEALFDAPAERRVAKLLQQVRDELGERADLIATARGALPRDVEERARGARLAPLQEDRERQIVLCQAGMNEGDSEELLEQLSRCRRIAELLSNRFFLSRVGRVQSSSRRVDFGGEEGNDGTRREERMLQLCQRVVDSCKEESGREQSLARCCALGVPGSGDPRTTYLDALVVRVNELFGAHLWMYGLPPGAELPLEEVYIEPALGSEREGALRTLREVIDERRASRAGAALLLVGEAAIGKSTLLRKLALDLAREGLGGPRGSGAPRPPLPLLVALDREEELGAASAETPLEELLRFAAAKAGIEGDLRWLGDAARDGRVAFLIDGLDELETRRADELRARLYPWIDAAKAAGCLLILSSRPTARVQLDPKRLEAWNLRGFERAGDAEDPVRAFLERYLRIRLGQEEATAPASPLEVQQRVTAWLQGWRQHAPLLLEQARHPFYLLLMARHAHERSATDGTLTIAALLLETLRERLRASWKKPNDPAQERGARWWDPLRWLAWQWTLDPAVQRGEALTDLARRAQAIWRGDPALAVPATADPLASLVQRLAASWRERWESAQPGSMPLSPTAPHDVQRWLEATVVREAPVFEPSPRRIELAHNNYREVLAADVLREALAGVPPGDVAPTLVRWLGLDEARRFARLEEPLLLLVQLLENPEAAGAVVVLLATQRSKAGLRALSSRTGLPARDVRGALEQARRRGAPLEEKGSLEGFRDYVREEVRGLEGETAREAWLAERMQSWKSYGEGDQLLAVRGREAQRVFEELAERVESDHPRPEERARGLRAQIAGDQPATAEGLRLVRALAQELRPRETSDLFYLEAHLRLWRPGLRADLRDAFHAAERALFERFGRSGRTRRPHPLEDFLPPRRIRRGWWRGGPALEPFPALEAAPFTCRMGFPLGWTAPDHQVHERRFERSFRIAAVPVLEEQLRAFFGEPCPRERRGHPATGVSWFDAMMYARFLEWRTRELEGEGRSSEREWEYDLPTEAEWEYASRGWPSGRYASSEPTSYPWGEEEGPLRDFAWYSTSRDDGTVEPRPGTRRAAEGRPNAFGLYDMLGNVWEWTRDAWGPYPTDRGPGSPEAEASLLAGAHGGLHRVRRGGGYGNPARDASCFTRVWSQPWGRNDGNGFRLARRRR